MYYFVTQKVEGIPDGVYYEYYYRNKIFYIRLEEGFLYNIFYKYNFVEKQSKRSSCVISKPPYDVINEEVIIFLYEKGVVTKKITYINNPTVGEHEIIEILNINIQNHLYNKNYLDNM